MPGAHGKEVEERAIALHKQGLSYRAVAREVGAHWTTVKRWVVSVGLSANKDYSGAESTQSRMARLCETDDENDCWEWVGTRTVEGYGKVTMGRDNNKPVMMQAHRASYETHIGPIPDGMTIDHLCANRGCVNPLHLEVVTMKENWARRGDGPHFEMAGRTTEDQT